MAKDKELTQKSIDWMIHADKYKYTYNYTWMGRPINKYPNDILIQQEIMWDIKPDLIIETGNCSWWLHGAFSFFPENDGHKKERRSCGY